MNHKRYKINYDNKNIIDKKINTKINNIYNNSDMTPIVLKEITLTDMQIGGNSVTSSDADTYTTTTTEVGSTENSSTDKSTTTDKSTETLTETTKLTQSTDDSSSSSDSSN